MNISTKLLNDIKALAIGFTIVTIASLSTGCAGFAALTNPEICMGSAAECGNAPRSLADLEERDARVAAADAKMAHDVAKTKAYRAGLLESCLVEMEAQVSDESPRMPFCAAGLAHDLQDRMRADVRYVEAAAIVEAAGAAQRRIDAERHEAMAHAYETGAARRASSAERLEAAIVTIVENAR